MTVRTRVAPSPTGDPHVGTAYMALINYCFAKSQGGQFLVRIEDTDQARSTAASERMILDSLRWMGLTWDEGPDIGGPHGSYRQSERRDVYLGYAQQLLENGFAFKCFCDAHRLDAVRKERQKAGKPPAYDGHCMHLSADEVARREAAGEPFVVRMKVPFGGDAEFDARMTTGDCLPAWCRETNGIDMAEGLCRFDDMLRGAITIPWANVDMQVLVKSDNLPTYHLANVVDDHLMEITHVLRGEEWISSAPKHLLLYAYFGWEMPKLCHLPLLRNPDRSKLSKRKNPTSILYYRDMGYLPQALLNYLGLYGVSAGEGEEMMGLEKMVEQFALTNISLGGPVFDIQKLDWLQGRHVRETMDADALVAAIQAWAFQPDRLRAIASLAQTRVTRLSDVVPLVGFLFAGRLDLDAARLRDVKLDPTVQRRAYHDVLTGIDATSGWSKETAETLLRAGAAKLDVKFKDYIRAFYLAITGSPTSIPLFEAMDLLGRDLVRERLRQAVATLGGVTSAEAKAWSLAPVGSVIQANSDN